MSKGTIILLVILAILIIGIIVLYFVGKRLQKKQAEQQEQIAAAAQSVPMLIIDKKKMKLKDAGLPAAIMAQMPKLMRRSKVPVVKAKIGPKITVLIDFRFHSIKKRSESHSQRTLPHFRKRAARLCFTGSACKKRLPFQIKGKIQRIEVEGRPGQIIL